MDVSGSGSTSSKNNNITRWNPTKDQVSILEGLYGQGMRTPTADQIQRITSRLRAYGYIEGKNVFYWFQNHKARQRQKEKELQQQQQLSSCLCFSYMNQRCLYFHNCSATAPGRIYRPAPSPSSTNVVFRPYYVAQNETAGGIPKLLLPSGSNRRLKVTNDDNDHPDKLKLSLTTATPFATKLLENNSKSTLDLFPVHPSGIEHGPRMITLGEEECSGCMEKCGGGDMPDMPFFDFLSVNGCCGQD